ncbi:tumor necrosis factor ligand superfamily member 6 [Acipenser oxyrinchus oxyrinchus]|uniref:Tumor necrosis factor ligand superfamily member 6 n=1 Tax=Acipenser oxyrinchus oxyrinchus TaxID=40147 RepID=A0AAD8D8P7_ACIOX|nr:tumor necrosis factor ligand superfamily member 6 [Acipenser oxyrinchus oxyrinchus]
MQQNLSYVYPQIFLVDRGGSGVRGPGHRGSWPRHNCPAGLASAALQLKQGRGGRGGCTALLLTLLLLTMAGLGLGAYYILRLQQELTELRQVSACRSVSVCPNTLLSKPALPVVAFKKLSIDLALLKQRAFFLPFPGFHKYQRPEPDASPGETNWTGGGEKGNQENGASDSEECQRGLGDPALGARRGQGLHGGHGVPGRSAAHQRDGSILPVLAAPARGTTCPGPGRRAPVFKRQDATPLPSPAGGPQAQLLLRERMWTSSSYLAAVVELQKFDRVSVNVSEPQLVSLEPANTYFGIYKI